MSAHHEHPPEVIDYLRRLHRCELTPEEVEFIRESFQATEHLLRGDRAKLACADGDCGPLVPATRGDDDLWQEYCLQEGLVQLEPWGNSFSIDLTTKGLLVLKMSAETTPAPANPSGPVLPRFDDATHTVHVDGKPYKVENPRSYAVYKVIVDACPDPVTKSGIRSKVSGVGGRKTIPALISQLPVELSSTVSYLGGAGYWYDQSPPPPKKRATPKRPATQKKRVGRKNSR